MKHFISRFPRCFPSHVVCRLEFRFKSVNDVPFNTENIPKTVFDTKCEIQWQDFKAIHDTFRDTKGITDKTEYTLFYWDYYETVFAKMSKDVQVLDIHVRLG